MTKVEVLVYLWFVHRQCDLYENATRVKTIVVILCIFIQPFECIY